MSASAMSSVDLEQVQLMEEPMPNTQNKRRVLQLTLGVVLLGALAGMLAFFIGSTTSSRAASDQDGLDGLIRAFSAERGHSRLTQVEVEAIKGFVEQKTSHKEDMLKYRILVNDVSPACNAAFDTQVNKHSKEMAKLLVDYAWDCWWGGEDSAPCAATKKRVNAYEQNAKDECAVSGDLCTFTQTSAGKTEEEHFCLPKECHDEAEAAALRWKEAVLEWEGQLLSHMHGNHDFSKEVKSGVDCGR